MVRSSRRARNVYDPSLESTSSGVFKDRDFLTAPAPEMEDIRNLSDVRDSRLHNDDKSTRAKWKYIIPAATIGLILVVTGSVVGARKNKNSSSQVKFLQPAPSNLDEICAPANWAENGPSEKQLCEEVCEWANCCNFPSNMDLSCLHGNEERCQEYLSSCFVLLEDYSELQDEPDFPPPPSFLDDMCSTISLSTLYGRDNCAEACQPAACCYSSSNSCAGNPSCVAYAPCLGLRASTHAHDDIARLVNSKCDPLNLQQGAGVRECESVCEQASCCFVDEGDGRCDDIGDLSFCAQYEGCRDIVEDKIINEKFEDLVNEQHNSWRGLPDVPFDLSVNCSPENVQRDSEKCEEQCVRARCCFANIDSDDSCLDGNQYQCMSYLKYCYVLEIEDVGLEVSPNLREAPFDIDTSCSIDKLSRDTTACANACAGAECCWADDVPTCNFDGRCESYSMCLALTSFGEYRYDGADENPDTSYSTFDLVAPPEDIEDLCSIGYLVSESGPEECLNICEKAECCDPDEGPGCYNSFPERCDIYLQHCEALVQVELESPDQLAADGLEIEEPPSDIAQVCSFNNVVYGGGKSSCMDICLKGSCCDTDPEDGIDCYNSNVQRCDTYLEYCQVLLQADEAEIPSSPAAYEVAPLPSNIGEACSLSYMVQRGSGECQSMCDVAACCDDDGVENCYNQNVERCDRYIQHCIALEEVEFGLGVTSLAAPPSNIAQVCTLSFMTQQGSSECQSICDVAGCCDDDQNNCYNDNVETCDSYIVHCIFLEEIDVGGGATTDLELPPSNIDEICNAGYINSAVGREECEDICDQAECCNSNDSNWGCYQSNVAVCDIYLSNCSILVQDQLEAGGEIAPPAYNIEQICSFDNVEFGEGRAACEAICQKGSCCDEDPEDGFNCYMENVDSCDTYLEYCDVLTDGL